MQRQSIMNRSTKAFRVNKSRSPGKSDIEKVTENINQIAVITEENISKVKEFMDHVTTKSSAMNNKKISAIKNANSLKALKESGFFSRQLVKTRLRLLREQDFDYPLQNNSRGNRKGLQTHR